MKIGSGFSQGCKMRVIGWAYSSKRGKTCSGASRSRRRGGRERRYRMAEGPFYIGLLKVTEYLS